MPNGLDAARLGHDAVRASQLRNAAWPDAGLAIKWEACSYASCSRDPAPAPDTCALLQRIPEAMDGTRARVFGATLRSGKDYSGEWDTVRRTCRSALHLRAILACTSTRQGQDSHAPLVEIPHPQSVPKQPVLESGGSQRCPHDATLGVLQSAQLLAIRDRSANIFHEAKRALVRARDVGDRSAALGCGVWWR